MSGRLLLVDSDVFCLLAAADLLHELAAALSLSPSDLRCLPALTHQLRKGKAIGRKLSDEQRQRALAAADATSSLTESPHNVALLEQLVRIDSIDPGEALLFATLCEQPAWLLTTGDKRSLMALGASDQLASVRDQIRGRILALESALVVLVRRLGAAEVGRRLAPLRNAHKTVLILFGHKTEFDDAETLRQIDSYLRDLVRQMGDDLLFPLEPQADGEEAAEEDGEPSSGGIAPS